MGAVTAVAGASGIRAWIGAKAFSWLTPPRMRAVTVSLGVAALIGASIGVSGA
jgi:hypothetical protein